MPWTDGGVRRKSLTMSSSAGPVVGLAVARPAGVHLPPVRQPAALVEDEEVRRAGGPVLLGHLLLLVVQVREGVARGGLFLLHLLGAVVGVGGRVVAVDADD